MTNLLIIDAYTYINNIIDFVDINFGVIVAQTLMSDSCIPYLPLDILPYAGQSLSTIATLDTWSVMWLYESFRIIFTATLISSVGLFSSS